MYQNSSQSHEASAKLKKMQCTLHYTGTIQRPFIHTTNMTRDVKYGIMHNICHKDDTYVHRSLSYLSSVLYPKYFDDC